MLIILGKNNFSVWWGFLFHKRRKVRICSLLDSCKSCLFFYSRRWTSLSEEKKISERFDLNIGHWHVHEKGLDDISFKCLLSVPKKTVTVTFLGCCSLGYTLLIRSQTFVKTGISQKNSVFNQALMHDCRLMKLLIVHLSKLIWSAVVLDLEIVIYIENSEV